jgi:hypothetical protein
MSPALKWGGRFKDAGDALWKMLKENKPEASGHGITFDVIPEEASWSDLVGGRDGVKEVRLLTDGMVWGTGVDVLVTIRYRYGALFHGYGAFLPSVTVELTHVLPAWNFSVDLDVQKAPPWNLASEEAPLAAVRLTFTTNVSWGVGGGTKLGSEIRATTVQIQGNGEAFEV